MRYSYNKMPLVASGLLMLFAYGNAQAVPSFARQTGMQCAVCHRTNYPELTAFGRNFKLNGYTLTGDKQISASEDLGKRGLKINDPAPLSAMLIAGFNQNAKSNGAQNNSLNFPQQFSLFYAGEITPHMGSFIQITYEQPDGTFGFDNTDLRYANTTSGGTTYGFTLNNGPTIQDLWNSSAAWGYPYTTSDAAGGPSEQAMLDGADAVMQETSGLGAYAMWGGDIYTELSMYRSTHQGTGNIDPTNTSADTLNGWTPYIRVAYNHDSGDTNYMVGAYNMDLKMYPSGVIGATNNYNDTGIDAQVQGKSYSAHATMLTEKRDIGGNSGTLTTTKLDGTYYIGERNAITLGYVTLAGSGSSSVFAVTNPDSAYMRLQYTYVPYQNTKFGVQYNMYSKLDGSTSGASDNNNIYLMGWFMF